MRQPISARVPTAYGARALQPRLLWDLGYISSLAATECG